MMEATMDWTAVERTLSIIGGVGGSLGAWALFRTHWMTRSKLEIAQKQDAGYNFVERGDRDEWLLVTLFITNKSSQPNSVLRYEASAVLRTGENEQLQINQGTARVRHGQQVLAQYHVCVTPLNLPPHTTTEAYLWIPIHAENFTNPLQASIAIVDMQGKRFDTQCLVPNVFAERF
jgi:hypothetical protein